MSDSLMNAFTLCSETRRRSESWKITQSVHWMGCEERFSNWRQESDMSVIGFDFGTTNSLVSVIKGNRAINFLDDEGLPIPSVVCYEGNRTIVGREAKERLSKAGLGVHGNIVRSPKMLLGDESVFIEGSEGR